MGRRPEPLAEPRLSPAPRRRLEALLLRLGLPALRETMPGSSRRRLHL
jgi:hypothetical protein